MTIRASAFVRGGHLCIVGAEESEEGVFPFAVASKIQGETKDGFVDFGADMDGPVEAALTDAKAKVSHALEDSKMERMAEELVMRARQGDQNAMAMLSGIRVNANRGVERAVRSAKYVERYLKRHPVESRVSFGTEMALLKNPEPLTSTAAIVALGPSVDIHCFICTLADGPPVEQRLESIQTAIDPNVIDVFMEGMRLSGQRMQFLAFCSKLPKDAYDAAKVGFLIGRAKRLQDARKGRISRLSPVAGWELGE